MHKNRRQYKATPDVYYVKRLFRLGAAAERVIEQPLSLERQAEQAAAAIELLESLHVGIGQ
jgi:hypothetical protein